MLDRLFQQCYVIGVVHGKETKFAVAVKERDIVLGSTRYLARISSICEIPFGALGN